MHGMPAVYPASADSAAAPASGDGISCVSAHYAGLHAGSCMGEGVLHLVGFGLSLSPCWLVSAPLWYHSHVSLLAEVYVNTACKWYLTGFQAFQVAPDAYCTLLLVSCY